MKTLIARILPVEEISEEVKKEKKGCPPTFEMHYWWTRKHPSGANQLLAKASVVSIL